MTIITPVPGIRFYDIRPELNCPLRAQVNIIYRSCRSTEQPVEQYTILSKIFVDKTPAGKIKDTVFHANNIDNLCSVI